MHDLCGRLGVVIRPHGNGLVFEDVNRGIRVKASWWRRAGQGGAGERLEHCDRLSEREDVEGRAGRRHRYPPMPYPHAKLWQEYEQALHEARVRRKRDWSHYRDTAGAERRRLKRKYRQQQHLLAALPLPGQDRKRLFRQLELRQTIETRTVKQKHATQRWAIQKTPHPGTWHHFVATRAAERDARAIRLLKSRQRELRPVQRGKGVVRFSEME